METFTPEERQVLAPYFTNLDGPIFALVNLPEVVKGALFARYSRSAKSSVLEPVDGIFAPAAVPGERRRDVERARSGDTDVHREARV